MVIIALPPFLGCLMVDKKRRGVYHKQRKNANRERRLLSSSSKSLSGVIATAAARSEYNLPFA
jgi:hypothetical protein